MNHSNAGTSTVRLFDGRGRAVMPIEKQREILDFVSEYSVAIPNVPERLTMFNEYNDEEMTKVGNAVR